MARGAGVDDPKYRVNQSIWLKAAAVSTNQFKAYDEGYFEAWLIAIAEALSDEPVSDGYATRLRGQRLLDAIASRGADTAAWDFITEETADPDLITLRVRLSRNRIRDAQKARYHRYKDSTSTDGPSRRRRDKKPVTITQQAVVIPSVQTDTNQIQIAERDELLVVARDDCPTLSVEDWVAKPIREMQFTGETKIPVVILYRDVVAHSWERYVIGSYAVTESDIAIIAANKDIEKVVVQIAGEVTGTRVTTLPGKRTQKLPPVTPSTPDEVPPNLRFMLCDEAREECRAFYDACITLFVFDRFINEMPQKFPFLTRLDQEFDGQYVRALKLFSAANPYREPATTPCSNLATALANGRFENLQGSIDYATKKACEIIMDKAPSAVKAKIWEEGLIPS